MRQENRVGQVIAGYRILKVLGQGGMGRTYLGEKNGVRVVIKEQLEGDPKALLQEAKFLAALRHPRLPQVLDFEKGFMVMEFVEGQSSEEFIEGLKNTAGWNTQEAYLQQVVDWGLQMADILHYLHSQKPHPIIHRDIKPSNIMLRPDGQLVLIDFGIARRCDPEKLAKRIKDTCPAGTEGYMAPEFVNFHISDPRCDIYSLGVVLHFWLSGEQPDPAGRQGLTRLKRTGDPLWDGLVEISEKCRHPEPAKRFQTAAELAAALRKLSPDQAQDSLEKTCAACQATIRASCHFCPVCGSETIKPAPSGGGAHPLEVMLASENRQVMESILDMATQGSPASLQHFRTYQKLLELEQEPGFSELICLDALPRVEKLPHQIEAAKTALGKMGGYCLLADEVGLGKTIEAGIIMKELLLRGLARRILILAPRALCTQWQQELFEKFDVFFLVFGRDVDYNLAWKCDRVIASYEIVQERFHRQGILSQRYDLVIMDEAHHLIGEADPRRSWLLTDFARAVGRQTNYFLMLSATPLHNDLKELHTLLTLLKPGSVDDYNRFRERYVNPDDPYKPRNVQELRQRLQSVMIRNTRRRVAELPFPRREAYRVPVQLSPQNRETFSDFRKFVRSQLWGVEAQNTFFRRSLQTLVESFHSSPAAFARRCEEFVRNFRKILEPRTIEILRGFQSRMTLDLLSDKFLCATRILKQLIERPDNKALVFTEYEDTADLLYRKLAAAGAPVVRFPGEDVDDAGERAMEALAAFQRHAAIMVCTQNAAEGLNLQFANCLVNFDLPWDPMKLEQRIGRIQRIGGRPKVYIYNVFLQGTVEEDILDILEKKIEMFGETIGQVEEILGNLADEESFEQIFLDIFAGDSVYAKERKVEEILSRTHDKSKADQILAAIFEEGELCPPTREGGPRETSVVSHLRCAYCGGPIPLSARFCDNCGKPVDERIPGDPHATYPSGRPDELSVTSGSGLVCPGCKAALPVDARFCDRCGLEQKRPDKNGRTLTRCLNCGSSLSPNALFCDECGRKVGA